MATRVLVVEDDPDIAQLVARYLDKAGFVTEVFALAPGETEDFVSYFTPTNCGPNTLTLVTATAFDVCTGNNVATNVSASCFILCPANPPLRLNSQGLNNGFFSFTFFADSDKTYTVQYTTLLQPTNWQTLTNFTGKGTTMSVSDTLTGVQRFYRVGAQ